MAGGGQFGDKRLAVDVGDRINDNVFVRLNGMVEDSGTYRQYGDLRRYGINPTATVVIDPQTTLKLSYEYFHDDRFPDRGIPRSSAGRIATATTPARSSATDRQQHPHRCQHRHGAARPSLRLGVEMHSQLRIADYDRYYVNTLPAAR